MTTIVGMEAESLTQRAFHLAIDQFSERINSGDDQLTPEDVISLVQDVCIEVGCVPVALPSCLVCIYTDARSRRDEPDYGHTNFITKSLVHDLERAMKAV